MTNDNTSVAQAVLEALLCENVEYVFGLTGSHVLPITDALVDAPQIRHIVSKYESNAVYLPSTARPIPSWWPWMNPAHCRRCRV